MTTNKIIQSYSYSTFNVLMQMNLSSFDGKPIDSFLAKIPSGYTLSIGLKYNLKKANKLIVDYGNELSIYIQIASTNHFNRNTDPSKPFQTNWDIQQCKKETTGCIRIIKGVNWYGCDNDIF